MNSSFISTTEGVHIWLNVCLWGAVYNIGVLSPLCHLVLKDKVEYTCCSGRRVFYSITTGRTTEIAEVSRRQPLEYWKIGPEVLTNGKLRREQLMLLESMMQGFCPETLNGTDGSTEL